MVSLYILDLYLFVMKYIFYSYTSVIYKKQAKKILYPIELLNCYAMDKGKIRRVEKQKNNNINGIVFKSLMGNLKNYHRYLSCCEYLKKTCYKYKRYH